MANDIVKKSDFSVKDPAGDIRKSSKEALGEVKLLKKGIIDLQKETKKLAELSKSPTSNKAIKDATKASRDAEKQSKALTAVRKEEIRLEKESAKAKKLLTAEIKRQEREEKALERQKQKNIKAAQKLRKSTADNANAFKILTKQTDNAQARFKRLAAQYGVTSKQARAAELTFRKLDDRLRKINNSARDGRRDVGRYGLALQKVKGLLATGLGALGLTAGIAGLARGIGNAIGIFSGFEKANSNLQAVLGDAGTKGNMDLLKQSAQELGATTAFTASEVAGLQIEFAKLGFDPKQIDNATESTLALAAAAGTELAEAAAVVGATLGGFGLDAAETARVTDVMAKSFSTSALDMEKFKEAMKGAAPAARAVGISVEKTTALLGTLANAGIAGSKAGNNLKTSLINLNKAGLTLDEGLQKVAASEDKLGTAAELVGKNAAASFLVLAEGTEITAGLEEGLLGAAGAAQKMADIQLDNLAGDVTILGSAWEGFILSVENGEGTFNRFARSVIKTTTSIVSSLTKQTTAVDKNIKSLEKEQQVLFELSSEILDTNTNSQRRNELLDELDELYPNILKNIDRETASYEELKAALSAANDELGVRISIQRALIEVDSLAAKIAEKRINIAENEADIQRELFERFASVNRQNELLSLSLEERIELAGKERLINGDLNALILVRGSFIRNLTKLEKELNEERKISNEVITALLSGGTKLEALSTAELRALVLNGQLTDRKLIRDAKLIIIQRERDERQKALNESLEKENELNEEGEKVETDRIRLKQKEISERRKVAAATLDETAAKNAELQVLQEELRVLRELGLEKEKQAEDDDDIENDFETIERIRQIREERNISEIARRAGLSETLQEELKAIDDEFDAREAAVIRRAKREEAITIEGSARELEIREQLISDLADLEQQRVDAVKNANKEIIEDEESTSNKRLEFANEVVKETLGILKERNKAVNEARDGEIDRLEDDIDDQRKAAQAGQENILADQKAALTKARLERQRELEAQAEQERLIALAQAFVNSFAAHSKDDPEGALAKALFETFAAKGIAELIVSTGSAYDGVDDTGGRGDVDSKGGKMWTLHPNEQVWSKADRQSVGMRTRDEIKDIVSMHDGGNLLMSPHAFKSVEMGNVISPNEVSLKGLESSIENQTEALTRTIKANAVKNELGVNKLGEFYAKATIGNSTKTRIWKKERRRA